MRHTHLIPRVRCSRSDTPLCCLTGFKYIGNKAEELANEGYEVLFGYEEAIGYMLSEVIRDKDGVSAASCFSELAGSLYGRGATLKSHLDDLYAK